MSIKQHYFFGACSYIWYWFVLLLFHSFQLTRWKERIINLSVFMYWNVNIKINVNSPLLKGHTKPSSKLLPHSTLQGNSLHPKGRWDSRETLFALWASWWGREPPCPCSSWRCWGCTWVWQTEGNQRVQQVQQYWYSCKQGQLWSWDGMTNSNRVETLIKQWEMLHFKVPRRISHSSILRNFCYATIILLFK